MKIGIIGAMEEEIKTLKTKIKIKKKKFITISFI